MSVGSIDQIKLDLHRLFGKDDAQILDFDGKCRNSAAFETMIRHLSTLGANSVSKTARKSTHTPKSTFGMVEPWSGRTD